MSTKVKEQEKDLFAEVKEAVDTEVEDVIIEHDDLQEGIMAESDPVSKMIDPLADQRGPAEDVVKLSLDSQLTALGRATAEKLNAQPKTKVMIPFKELNPDDKFVVVGTNGWNTQILRGKPVLLPDVIIERLSISGEAPTLVR